jgi:hypothetical protein
LPLRGGESDAADGVTSLNNIAIKRFRIAHRVGMQLRPLAILPGLKRLESRDYPN